MNKIKLSDFKNDLYLTMSVLPIDDIDELLEFNSKFTAAEVFKNIIEDTLLTHEKYFPYKATLKLPNYLSITGEGDQESWVTTYYMESDGKYIPFSSNVEQVFFGLLPETDLNMVPLAIKGLKNTWVTNHPTVGRNFSYERPNLFGVGITSFRYYSGIFQYPVISDTRTESTISLDKTWILFMDKGTDNYRVFKSAMIVRLCEYIQNLKNNFTLPGLPIEVFGSLNEIMNKYKELVQVEYSSSLNSLGWD